MRYAARFGMPIVTLVDTPGAYPGIGAEERGQSNAIAESIMLMSRLPVPIVSVVTGEGGSGGALALAAADRVLMMENAYYSVISPEGCATILFKDATAAPRAAEALRMTGPDLLALGVIDARGARGRRGEPTRIRRRASANLKTAIVDEPARPAAARLRAAARASVRALPRVRRTDCQRRYGRDERRADPIRPRPRAGRGRLEAPRSDRRPRGPDAATVHRRRRRLHDRDRACGARATPGGPVATGAGPGPGVDPARATASGVFAAIDPSQPTSGCRCSRRSWARSTPPPSRARSPSSRSGTRSMPVRRSASSRR